jgi:hypothetical protein
MRARYADKAERQYVDEHGTRIRHIPEVTITAQRNYSQHYFARDVQFSLTAEDIKKRPSLSTRNHLSAIPMLRIDGEALKHGNRKLEVVVHDQFGYEITRDIGFVLYELDPSEIVRIDLVPAPLAGRYGIFLDISHYVLFVNIMFKPKETPYIKYFRPLGFQKPAEFYAPKYDTPAQNTKPDLRTTIHWAPNLTTDENGKATFSFYTADTPSTYTVVIEGVTEDGKIIYRRDKIVVEKQ